MVDFSHFCVMQFTDKKSERRADVTRDYLSVFYGSKTIDRKIVDTKEKLGQ